MTAREDGEQRRRHRAERIFLAALERSLSERGAFVADRCHGDPDLEGTVRSLLEAHDRTGPLDRMQDELSRWQGDLLADGGDEHGEPDGSTTMALTPAAGDRYRIEALLGRGGMGEVWRAYDLKLRLDVALKWLRTDLLPGERALELLRREVRAAREVISPNVCRVFDLQEIDGRELIAMEYVEGTSLREILDSRGPLNLQEAREIAAQFLAGLAAIHDAGLVHRDIKPDNLMITHTGRVVVMDFGIAKGLTEGRPSMIAGTLAYMSPEQRAGGRLDGRSDLFAAGVVLAEMVDPAGVRSREAREAVWARIHQGVPQVSATPWSKVIARAVAPSPDDRYGSASAMARALEEVTLRAVGDEEARPYPGLSAFEREDADFFFGRELEVEALWRKLRPARLLAVTGASGAGKSSFLRAGLLPSLPESWSAVLATPGDRPFVSLARALAEVLPGDPGTVDSLLRFEEPAAALALVSRWRRAHEQCLVVLDQFEELFTQNPVAVQASFADLLAKVPLEADVHVLLSLRDDFLLHCRAHAALSPIFSELTPLAPPTGAALRRAIVQPALKCGYRFEDETLVEEMLAQVEGERGSLPMAAFAAAGLWQLRDREGGLLTREAYQLIGGVSGALAQHAERALDRIGEDRVPIVRELFRNLVTAKGTRVARSRHQLLSVFAGHADEVGEVDSGPDREAAAEVLDTLIDARLLTSYEVPGEEENRQHRTRIEIVHESLLTSWPRLERWQAQEADSAQLRDQLRQAAQAWLDRGRPVDLLWSGTSYQEFQIWRERYPGGLSRDEQEFAAAMTAQARRRQRRRRTLTAAVIAALVAGILVVGVLWRQATTARDRSRRETLRAEANQLLALARLELEDDRTAALAYVTASLERVDAPAARRMAIETLWSGPSALVLDQAQAASLDFSPDGRWLAVGSPDGRLVLWSRDGKRRALASPSEGYLYVRFGGDSDRLLTVSRQPDTVRIWSIPDGEVLHSISSEDPLEGRIAEGTGRLFVFTKRADRVEVEARPLAGGATEPYGALPASLGEWSRWLLPWPLEVEEAGNRLAFVPLVIGERLQEGRGQWERVEVWEALEGRFVSSGFAVRHEAGVGGIAFSPDGGQLATGDRQGEVRIWGLDGTPRAPRRTLRQPAGIIRRLEFDRSGALLAAMTSIPGQTALWRLDGAPATAPTILRRGTDDFTYDVAFDPGSSWLTTASDKGVMAYPIGHRDRQILEGGHTRIQVASFLPDGSALASASSDGAIRLWPLSKARRGIAEVLLDIGEVSFFAIEAAPDSQGLLIGDAVGGFSWLPLDGSAPRLLGVGDQGGNPTLALSSEMAAAAVWEHPAGAAVYLWSLATGERRTLVLGEGADPFDLAFGADGSLVVADTRGIHVWQLEEETSRTISERPGCFDLSADGRLLIAANQGDGGQAALYDLERGTRRLLDRHGPAYEVAIDRAGRLVATMGEELRVGSVEGEDPHHLVAQDVPRATEGAALHGWERLEFSPDGRWIASVDQDVVLWPVPDVTQPPLHTLPREELLSKLRSLTNLRVVEDPESPNGWTFHVEPFPGWEKTPTW